MSIEEEIKDILFEHSIANNTFTWKKHKNLGYPPRFHTAVEIYFVNKGKIGADINGITYTVNEGEIVVVNPLEIHKYDRLGDAFVSVFIFDNSYLSDFKSLYKDKLLPTHLKDVEYNKKIYDILSDIEPSVTSNTSLSALAKKAYVNLVLDKIISRYDLIESSATQNHIMDIINFIYNNLDEKITLDFLAKQFHYSKQSISRLLSKYLKTDLRKFVNDLRAEKAKEVLSNEKYNDMTLLDIATACGFESLATFYRSYKRRFFCLPERKNRQN